MDIEVLTKERRSFAQRYTVCLAFLALSLATNVVISLQLMNSSKVVLVPVLAQEAAININGGVSQDYLERVALDFSFLFLNRTTQTARYLEQRGEKLIDPETFEALRLQMANESRKATDLHQTQSFEPINIFVDTPSLYAEVTGNVVITSGQSIIDNQQKIFAMQFSKRGSMVLLKAIKEIDPSEARSKPSSLQSTVGGY